MNHRHSIVSGFIAIGVLMILTGSVASADNGRLQASSSATLNSVVAFNDAAVGEWEVMGVAVEFFGVPGRGEVFLDIHQREGLSCFLSGPGGFSFGTSPKARFVLDDVLDGKCEVFAPEGSVQATVEVEFHYPHARVSSSPLELYGSHCVEHVWKGSWEDIGEEALGSIVTVVVDGHVLAMNTPGDGEVVDVAAVLCSG